MRGRGVDRLVFDPKLKDDFHFSEYIKKQKKKLRYWLLADLGLSYVTLYIFMLENSKFLNHAYKFGIFLQFPRIHSQCSSAFSRHEIINTHSYDMIKYNDNHIRIVLQRTTSICTMGN